MPNDSYLCCAGKATHTNRQTQFYKPNRRVQIKANFVMELHLTGVNSEWHWLVVLVHMMFIYCSL